MRVFLAFIRSDSFGRESYVNDRIDLKISRLFPDFSLSPK